MEPDSRSKIPPDASSRRASSSSSPPSFVMMMMRACVRAQVSLRCARVAQHPSWGEFGSFLFLGFFHFFFFARFRFSVTRVAQHPSWAELPISPMMPIPRPVSRGRGGEREGGRQGETGRERGWREGEGGRGMRLSVREVAIESPINAFACGCGRECGCGCGCGCGFECGCGCGEWKSGVGVGSQMKGWRSWCWDLKP
jgi:hypothetical protein